MRAARGDSEIPLNPFTAGVYVATMMATVYVLKQKVRSLSQLLGGGQVLASRLLQCASVYLHACTAEFEAGP